MSTTCICLYIQRSSSWAARVAQWWEHSSPTNVAWVRVLASTSNVGRVCCRFSPLFREVFLRVLRFSPLLKNQNVQIPIGPSQVSGRRRPPSGSATTKLLFIYLFMYSSNRPFAISHSRGTKLLRCKTSDALKELSPLFFLWVSQCAPCSPAKAVLYYVSD